MKAIGIDLGTTNSLMAVGGGETRILVNRENESLTPSVVSYRKKRKTNEGEIVVGRQARSYAAKDPVNTIFSIKRLMGSLYGEEQLEDIAKKVSYRLADPPEDSDDQGVKVLLGGKPYTPVEISALILEKLKRDAELALGEPVTHAVITVPAYFQERQREATRKAGELAGLKVLKIIDEPTAAAVFFGADKEKERHRVLVYDLGGGTFDISIIQMVSGQYQVLEVSGNTWLGGDDFDKMVVQRMINWLIDEEDYDPSKDRRFLGVAKEKAEELKKALTVQDSAEIIAPMITKTEDGQLLDIEMEITREAFEEDIQPFVDQTIQLTEEVLARQNLTTEDITRVLLVGGSTAVPLVQNTVSELFGAEKVRKHVNPMECVALGAAILTEYYELTDEGATDAANKSTLMEVTAMHLGIAAVKGDHTDEFVPIIPKNTNYPLSEPKRRTFELAEENQKILRVPVYEGLNPNASLNTLQGSIEFPLPEGLQATTPVEISFNYDANRVLTVTVHVVGTDIVKKERLRRGRVVQQPKKQESLADDWREELQPAIRAMQHFLGTYGDYIDEENRQEIGEALALGEDALANENRVAGDKAVRLLQHKLIGSGVASQLFMAERVMQGADMEATRELARGVANLRSAYEAGDTSKVNSLSNALRAQVALQIAKSSSIGRVEDQKDLKGYVRERESKG